jgi:tRNA dimethylallyltransferase
MTPIKHVIAIVGSTATGKTSLGIDLAQQLQTDIISADSQLIYKGLDIGTAKPSLEERQGISHHMIDVCLPNEIYSAATYQRQALVQMQRLWDGRKIPILVGGTGFYLRNLLEADIIPDVPPNPIFRDSLLAFDAPQLHARLTQQDVRRAAELHPNDRARIIRALEIIEATGKPVPQPHTPKDISVLWIGLTYDDRTLLDNRIKDRIDIMIQAGWIDEVSQVMEEYGKDAHALKLALGYPELVQVISGTLSLEEAVEQIQINVRQYARRQMTWFKRNEAIHWLDCETVAADKRLSAVQPKIDNFIN